MCIWRVQSLDVRKPAGVSMCVAVQASGGAKAGVSAEARITVCFAYTGGLQEAQQ